MMPLLRLELRRQRSLVVRMIGLTILVCLVFYALGKRTQSDRLAIVIGTSLSAVILVPMGISREKMEGTLDFVCGLPVEPRTIAASRFAAAAIIALPWATGIGFVSTLAPTIGALNGVVVAVLAWLGIMLLCECCMALFTIFDLESLIGWPFAAFIISLMVLPRVVRAVFPGITEETILQLLQRPATPVVLSLVLLIAAAIVGALSFAMTTRGFANYRPGETVIK
jgi:hypothetical protein